jgi:adenylate kinase family enzyme
VNLIDVANDVRLSSANRIVIAGPPRAGKTTLAGRLGFEARGVRHTDDVMALGWSESSQAVTRWFDADGPWIVEGVATPRALRKWFARGLAGTPADLVVWLGRPLVSLDVHQESMAKGCRTVWDEIRPTLFRRGVTVREFS